MATPDTRNPDTPIADKPLTDLRLLRARAIDERRMLIGAMLQSHGEDSLSKPGSADKLVALQQIVHDLDAAIAQERKNMDSKHPAA